MKTVADIVLRTALPTLLAAGAVNAAAQQLATHFSCSATQERDGEPATLADNGEFRLDGDRISTFRWESALYRSTHGFDCSIDEEDGLLAEVRNESGESQWRISLADARQARDRRGYDFDRGMNCTIRLERMGNQLAIKPSCPALCGSRGNFSALSVDLKTGKCHYEE
ncbi:hypothetical protein [Noviherbaspirillum massiliense]|uniref:hypothetical protein n=1 Tax=Noviherbaspirillum massiliense TaxID=1465823 RepID=UPI000307F01B|nr:hypothetical protein [Noviherbaspirillum massiliense]